jgi:hypothetical protein
MEPNDLAVDVSPELASGMMSSSDEPGDALPSTEEPAPDPIATRLAALEEGLAAERAEKANLEQRLRDTQAWGNQAHQAQQFAQAQISAQAQEYERRKQQDAWAASLQPPTFTEDEREAMIADPNVLTGKMFEVADWTRRRTLAEVGPHLEAARAFNAIAEPLFNQGREIAIERARGIAEKQLGIDAEMFDQLLPAARQILDNVPDRAAASKMSLDSTVIAHAINVARTQGGVPLKKPKAAPTIGAGNATPGAAPVNHVSAERAAMERKFGIKLPDAGVREIEAKYRPNPRRGAAGA